jgi:hypothetical protein
MTALSKRACRLIVGTSANAKVIDGLRVQFKVKKSVNKEPNEGEISITNLAESSRAALQTKGIKVVLEAGYAGTLAQIFSGDVRYVSHTHDGPDWTSKLQLGDGETAYRFAFVSESFRAGTPISTVFSKVANALGLDSSDAIAFVRKMIPEQFTQGFASHGKASKELDRLLAGRGLEWSIQDGRLQVTATGQPTSGSAVLLSASSGLIGSPAFGSPEKSDKGVDAGSIPAAGKKKQQVLKAKSLLQPSIRPGGRVQLDSLSVKGQFRVQSVTHSGDTHGGDWYSEMDLIPV